MEANIDGYSQMRVHLSNADLDNLEKCRRLNGRIWRTAKDWEPDQIDFIVYLRERGCIKAFSIPRNKIWEEKTSYVLRLIPEAVSTIRKGQYVGLEPTSTRLRNLIISLMRVY